MRKLENDAAQSFNQALIESRGGSLGAGPVRGWIMKNKLVLTGIGTVVATVGIIGYRVVNRASERTTKAA